MPIRHWSIAMPANSEKAMQSPAQSTQPPMTKPPNHMNKPRILVVDDDVGISGLVRFLLNKTGRFEVLVENRSAHALAVARDFLPDMILLDVDMPGKDGGDVARELQSDSELHSVPIVFLTSLVPRAEGGEHSVMRGGMTFLSKPASLKVLLETVDRVLSGRGIAVA